MILEKRNMLGTEERNEKSRKIAEKLYELETFKNADDFLLYVDYRSEVITRPLIDRLLNEGKKVYCPKVIGMDISFYRIDRQSDLASGYQGILEPAENVLKRYTSLVQNDNSIVIVPGSVFDIYGNRMGYGKGFYDRFLSKYQKLCRIAVCFDLQISDNVIPHNENDIKMNYIISERRTLRING